MNYGNHFSEHGHSGGEKTNPVDFLGFDADRQSTINIYPVEATSNVRAHCHRLIELIITFRSASGEIVLEKSGNPQRRLPIGEYQCCFLPSGICHAAIVENKHRHVSLFIDLGTLSESLSEYVPEVVIEDLRKLTWSDPFTCQLVDELDRLNAVYSESVLVHSMLTTLAVKVMNGFLRIHVRCEKTDKKRFAEAQQERAHTYIQSNLEKHFSVASLAKHMAMSLPHLNRRFRATFGMSPLQYSLKIRVDTALAFLRNGDARIADAAFAVGFCDQSHFDRHCRKFYGFPPGALIRAAR
ncbi:MAG: helix-turn-helix transcriptional regulator [Opitutaceae bacterium]|nr:helix-turn-helix transcriptional regulator [Opitutaceae bacterium]